MKVFVYTKDAQSRKIATLTDIVFVSCTDGKIIFVTSSGVEFPFDCKKVKTTCYQN